MTIPEKDTQTKIDSNDQVPNDEKENQVTFEQFRQAFSVFSRDYQIVQHPDTPVRTPFDEPNEPVIHHGELTCQYNLTQIPSDMTEEEFINLFRQRDTIFISCMDRDAVRPSYKKLQEEGKKIFLISVAGGVIQEGNRLQALETVMEFLGQHAVHINEVISTGHDFTCGYVKYAINSGQSLAETLNVKAASNEEARAMKQMILYYSNRICKFFGSLVKTALVKIDRKGNAVFDSAFDGIQAASLEDVISKK